MRNVGDRKRHDSRMLTRARQPPSLDPRQVLANGIDLADRCARTQQCAGHLLLLGKRHALDRSDPVGGSTA